MHRRKLGVGAVGTVFEVFDRERNAVVALKTLRDLDGAAIYRFKQEFRSLSDLTHPNLVKLYELLSCDGAWFFTMECLSGVSFRDYVRPDPFATVSRLGNRLATGPTVPVERGDVDLHRLRDAAGQLAQGLYALHQAGKLHRDIKPSNVCVTDEGRVVLCDFGLVTETVPRPGDSTRERRIVGTPLYMAPEQAAGHSVSEACDWYAVGVMLYEALAGRCPFVGHRADVMSRKQCAAPLPPTEYDASAPADLVALCMALLSPQPQHRPTGREVLLRLGVGVPVGPAPVQPGRARGFVGRVHQLDALSDAFARVERGESVVVRLHGGSGVGKSALIHRFVDSLARRDRATVLEGRCYEQESVPFKALDTVVDALSRHLLRLEEGADALMPRHIAALTRLFPVLRRVDAATLPRSAVLLEPGAHAFRERAVGALRQLLRAISARQPLVIAIDDLQWGDKDSAALLNELLHPPDAPRLLLIAAYRSEDNATSPFLREFVHAHAIDIPLAPLSATESADLVRALAGHTRGVQRERLEAIARESGGNAFLLTELVHYTDRLSADESLDDANISVEVMLERRLRALPRPARHLLEAIAVAGRPVSKAVAKQAARLDVDPESTMVQLRADNLLRSRGVGEHDAVEPYHDRIRETVVARMSAHRLRNWHYRLARALEDADEPDREALATHFHGAGDHERAAHHALLAAEQASDVLAFDRAAEMFRFALDVHPVAPERQSPVLAQLAGALGAAGRGAEAADAYLRAAEHAEPNRAIEYRRAAAQHYLRSGHLDRGLDTLRSLLAHFGMTLPTTQRRALASLIYRRARVKLRGFGFAVRRASDISAQRLLELDTCWSAATGLGWTDTLRGVDFHSRHLLLALDAGDTSRIARALATEGMYRSTGGQRTSVRSRKLIELAFDMGEAADDAGAIGWAHCCASVWRYQLGEFSAALASAEAALAVYRDRQTGVVWETDTGTMLSLWSQFYLGRVGAMARSVPGLIRAARKRNDLFGETSLSIGLPALRWLVADDAQAGLRESHEAISRWSYAGFHLQHYWEWMSRGQFEVYEGRAREAHARIRASWSFLRESKFLRMQAVRAESFDLRGRAALAAFYESGGTDRGALRDAARMRARLAREPLAWPRGLAALLDAGIAAAQGQDAVAIERYAQAEQILADAGMAVHASIARGRRGALIGGEQGRAMATATDAHLRAETIANPSRWAQLFAPIRRG